MTTANNTASAPRFVPNVIPRFSQERGGIVVLADEFSEDKVKAFVANSNSIVEISQDEYKHTEPVSVNDSKVLVDTFKSVMNIEVANVRARRPYTKQRHATMDKILQSGAVPEEQRAVLQHIVDNAPRQKRKYTKRSEAATNRMVEDSAKAAAVSLKAIQGSADESIKAQAVEDLSRKIAQLILSAL